MSEEKPRDWAGYYAKTSERAPRPTLLRALDLLGESPRGRQAVDLGCGGGRDSIEMLRRGWKLLAIDAEAAAIAALTSRNDLPPGAALEGRVGRFEHARWPQAELVNSSFALPLCDPGDFTVLWRNIVQSLMPGGCFAGQLFGERDSFHGRAGITTMSREQARGLLDGLDVAMFEEEETDAITPRGKPKHWHLFHIVARRPRQSFLAPVTTSS